MAPALIALSFATVAHAQGTMDFSGAQTLMGTFKTFAIYAGAVICFGGLIFAGIRMMSGRFQDAISSGCDDGVHWLKLVLLRPLSRLRWRFAKAVRAPS